MEQDGTGWLAKCGSVYYNHLVSQKRRCVNWPISNNRRSAGPPRLKPFSPTRNPAMENLPASKLIARNCRRLILRASAPWANRHTAHDGAALSARHQRVEQRCARARPLADRALPRDPDRGHGHLDLERDGDRVRPAQQPSDQCAARRAHAVPAARTHAAAVRQPRRPRRRQGIAALATRRNRDRPVRSADRGDRAGSRIDNGDCECRRIRPD